MEKNKAVAAKIKEIRNVKNIRQQHVAKGLGISETAYNRIENGQTQLTINNLFIVAELLETSVSVLLDLKDDKIANNHNSVIMSQFNSGSVAIAITPKEFNDIYNQVQQKAKR
jgi:transcriptional regulator with XRE-family HTH domain